MIAFIQTYPALFNILVLLFAILLIFTLYQLSRKRGSKDEIDDGNWVRVHTTMERHEAEIFKGMLENNQIEAVILNKRDSAYQAWGEIHLYVKKEDEIRAKELVEEHQGKAE